MDRNDTKEYVTKLYGHNFLMQALLKYQAIIWYSIWISIIGKIFLVVDHQRVMIINDGINLFD